jgi:DNA (cytosine-5)-methyltransferase 1
MLTPQFLLPIHDELVVDLFAGGGGASTGMEQHIGRAVDIAVNHDPEAIRLHQANHPQTKHYVSNVWKVDPRVVCNGRPIGLLWASPDCTFHSKARGGKPFRDRNTARRRRGLAGIVVQWVRQLKPTGQHPRVIHVENVEEFQHWGPLQEDGTPCPKRRGSAFQRWVAQLRNLGYAVEWRVLRGCDYGAPTIRKRLFVIARRDGQPIVWPEPNHDAPHSIAVKAKQRKPWRTSAECIDWSIPAPSIFERKKPLAEATCRRIAKGVMRYIVNAREPFIVSKATEQGLVNLHGQHSELVGAFLAKHYTGVVGSDLADPMATITSVDHHSLVTAHLVHMGQDEGKCRDKRTSRVIKLSDKNYTGRSAVDDEPKPNAKGQHHSEVRAFLLKYYGTDQDPQLNEPLHTVTTKDRFGLVIVHGEPYGIVDIGMRMLTPRELYTAQGFPENYVINQGADGQSITKTAQVRMCGNSVCPPLAHAIVAANYAEPLAAVRKAA